MCFIIFHANYVLEKVKTGKIKMIEIIKNSKQHITRIQNLKQKSYLTD